MVALSSLAGAGWQFFGNNGLPLAGGKLFTYAAGTTTPLASYTSSSGATPHANPIILDSAGRVPNEVWLTSSASYKFTLKTAANVEIWTKDNVPGILPANTAFTAATIEYDPPFTGALTSDYTISDKLAQTISVKDFGAIGDGTLHPLSEYYATLAAAQAVYPFATSLTNSVDRCAIQLAYLIAFNSNGGIHPDIDLGFGTYVIDADIQGYQYVNLRGRGAGTSNSGPPTNGWLTRGSQTTLVAASGYNGNMILFNANSTRTAQFTGSISGTTLTVTAVASGTIRVGNGIQNAANGITFGTQINHRGTKKVTASIAGVVVTVSAVDYGTLALGDTLFSGNTILGTITAMSPTAPYTGTGGVGTYEVSASQTVASTTITAGATNVYTVNKSQTVGSGTIYTGDSLTDTSISRVCFRGNWTGPGDATNTTGRAIAFDGVYPIQNCYFEECEFHNFTQDAIYGNVVPLPGRFRRLWGRYLGGSVIHFDYNANRGTHSLVFDDIQGDFIGGVSQTVDAAGNALTYQPALIMLDGSLRVAAGQNMAAEDIVFRDLKHEIDSSASSTTAYSPNTVQLHMMERVTVAVENVNTQPSNPLGGGTPVTNAILLLTGTKISFYSLANCRLGSSILVTDYLVDDQVRSITVAKEHRFYSFTRELNDTYMPSSTDPIERTGTVNEGTGARSVFALYQREASGKQSWGDGTASLDTNLYRFTADSLRTDDAFTAERFMQRGGTALVAGDFALAAGWGTSASVVVDANSIDGRWRITVTSNGTGQTANPTITLTFKKSYPIAMFPMVLMGQGGTGTKGRVDAGTPSVASCSFQYVGGTPVAGDTYIFQGFMA